MEDKLDLNKSICRHADLQKTIIVTDVKSLVAMLQSHWLDLFTSVQQDLVCLSPGKVAPPKIQQDLLTAKAVGEKVYQTFHIKRLKSQPSQIKFHDTITKAKLQTFTKLNKKVHVQNKMSKEII